MAPRDYEPVFKARPNPVPAGPERSALSPHNSPRQREPGEDVGSLPAGQAAFIHLREVARISYGTRRSGSGPPPVLLMGAEVLPRKITLKGGA